MLPAPASFLPVQGPEFLREWPVRGDKMKIPGPIFAAACILAVITAPALADLLGKFPDCAGVSVSTGRSIEACTKALELGSLSPREMATAFFLRGRAYISKGDPDRAIADYSEAIRLNPADAGSYDARAETYMKNQDYRPAIEDYSKLISINPLSFNAYRQRAKAWEALGETVKAEADNRKAEEARTAIEERGKERSVISNCSYRDAKLGPDWRIDVCTKALALPYDSPQQKAGSYQMRGLAYLEKNDPDLAIADFGEAILIAPDFAGFFGNRGDAYLLKKDWGHAVADYSQAIALMPDGSPRFYSGRAKAYEAQGDAGRAKADLAKADELGNKGLALTELMKCYRGSEGDALVAACTKVLAMPQLNAKQRVGAILNRGAAYANKQDMDRAMADYAEALRLDPNSAPAYFFRATAYMMKRDTAHAIADIGEAIRRSPKTADLYFYRGNAYSAQKDYSYAIADYSQAITLNPDGNASYYRSRATAYAALGDKERAAADEQSMKQARHGPPVGGGLPELLRQDPLGR